jgi:Ca2+-binding RTX toxin-like protein
MATSLKWSGPSRVVEGENITLTVDRIGDLSERYIFKFSPLNWWTIPSSQLVDASDLAGGGQDLRVIMEPGQSRTSFSIGTLNDGVAEGREFITVGYNIYTEFNGLLRESSMAQGISNNGNVWDATGVGPWAVAVDDYVPTDAPIGAPVRPQPVPESLTQVPTVIVSGNNNFVNTGTINFTDNSTKNFVYTDNSVNYNYTTTSITTNRTFNGSGRSDSITGAATNDLLAGGKGNDVLTGEAGGDTLQGQVGNDTLYGGEGLNTFAGGAGKDKMYIADDGTADIIKDLNKGDKIYIQGATRGGFTVGSVDGGLGIFNQGDLAAVFTGTGVSQGQLQGMLGGY